MLICSHIILIWLSGLPKPASIVQVKAMGIGNCLTIVSLTSNDIVYTVLPLYHSSGGGIGMMGTIKAGMLMRRKKNSIPNSKICFMLNPGLPKPVFIRQMKLTSLSGGFLLVDFNKDDVLYMTLPLYHSAGGGLGHYGCIRAGMMSNSVLSVPKRNLLDPPDEFYSI